MSLKVAAIDAFSTEPLGGNGATVVLLEQPAESLWMQRLAAEFNQSETAFLWSNQGLWYLRWFTPAVKWSCAAMPPWRPAWRCITGSSCPSAQPNSCKPEVAFAG